MNTPVIDAAMRLADILGRENAALRAMDMPAATALLVDKAQALAAFTAAGDADARVPEASRPTAETLAGNLRALVMENRRLLDIALHVQGRVLGLIARAAAQQTGHAAPRYGGGGTPMPSRPAAIAISARA